MAESMTDDRWRMRELGGGLSGTEATGRDVIAITSVGGRSLEGSVILPGSSRVNLRTAAMAMAALPMAG